jgi:rubredoxin
VNTILNLIEPETIAEGKRERGYYNGTRWIGAEDNLWICPRCNKENFARLVVKSYGPDLIMTPRIYQCKNNQCNLKRFYWRDHKNTLFARYLGKYEDIDELAFTSRHDPLKYYQDYKPVIPNQIPLL